MSTAVTVTPSAPAATPLHSARPSFVGIVRGELFKVSRQLSTWVLAVLYLGAICLPYLVLLGSGRTKTQVRDDPMMRLDEFRMMAKPAGRDVTELYAVA